MVKFLVLILTWTNCVLLYLFCRIDYYISKTDRLVMECMYWLHFLFIYHSWLMFSPVIYGWRKVEMFSRHLTWPLVTVDVFYVQVLTFVSELRNSKSLKWIFHLLHYNWKLCGSVYSIHRVSDWLSSSKSNVKYSMYELWLAVSWMWTTDM